MIVLAFTPEEAVRLITGTQTVVTYARQNYQVPSRGHQPGCECSKCWLYLSSLVGQTVAIALTSVVEPCDNCGQIDEHECNLDGEVYGPYRRVGAIVGSARVADVVPIASGWLLRTQAVDDITDQLPLADFSPDRWAVILTDAAPCEKRCPACGGTGTRRGSQRQWSDLSADWTCVGLGWREPIPCDILGPIGEWTP